MAQAAFVIKISNTIKSLKKLSESEYETDQCLDYFKKIDNSFNDEKSFRADIAKAMIESNYPEISLRCLKHYTRKNIFENDQTWPCTFYLLRSIWNYTDISCELSLACVCFISILLDFLSNEYLSPSDEEDEKLFKLTLNILNNIAQQPETKVIFQQYQASKILKKLAHIENEHLKVLVYLILAQIVNENEFDKLNDPSSEVIESISSYIKESLKKDKRYKGITTGEYLNCMAKLAVTKDNKAKIIECGMLVVFKAILNNSSSIEDQNYTLRCLWNLSFDEKICELFKKDKDFLTIITNLKNLSPSEEVQRKSSGILFTINDLKKKELAKNSSVLNSSSNLDINKSKNQHIMISYNSGSRDLCLKIKDELKEKGFPVWIDVEQIYGSSLASMAEAVENASVFLMCVSEKYYLSPNCRLEAEYAVKLQKPIIPLIMQADYMPLGWLGIIIGGKIYYKFSTSNKSSFEQTFSSMVKEINRYLDDSSSSSSNTSLNRPIKTKQLLNNNITNNYSNNIPLINNMNNNNNNNSTNNSTCTDINKSPNFLKQSYSNKQISDWTSRDVKQWISSLSVSSWIVESDVFDNVNGSLLRELNEIKKNAPDSFYNIMRSKLSLKPKLTTSTSSTSSIENSNFQLSDLLKISSELSEIFNNK